MFEVTDRLYVGSLDDLRNFLFLENPEDFYILYCAKDPCHKNLVGYEGKSCPKDHPEYLVARRGNQMALNMVDAPSPKFFSKEMITAGLDFMEEGYNKGLKVLVTCNQGVSRSPSMAFLFMATRLKELFEYFGDSIRMFKQLYPNYMPGDGIYAHMLENWDWYMSYSDVKFNPAEDDICPYCGCKELDYDVLHYDDGAIHDIIDCPKCKKRLWEED